MIKLPKPYISYSQIRLWLDNKDFYRDRYYANKDDRKTTALMFGSEIAKGLEEKTIIIPDLVLLPVQEFKINIEIEDIPVFAYLDQYDPDRKKFREIKTGQMKVDGSPRWNQNAVNQHFQLDMYSLLIEESQGCVDDETHLDWLHVRHKIKEIEFDGMILKSDSNELELTGEVTSFRRVIVKTERDRMRILLKTVAHEISNDYQAWLKYQESYIN